ncbi:Response regulator receiver domain-containing protein [Aureimonas phyllosphaerae]|nr:response regulator [Aureimonas phyllosphaerae]SFF30593.1 Response regulator receiver domain-containing protein [Aureimonas phyllosphaerae]
MHGDLQAGSRKVVLVVDDEPLVRLNAVDMFEEMGFEVLEASDGASALRVLERRPDVALLFSDCRMPGMSGPELAQAVAERYPQVRIVLVSGYVNVQKLDWPLLPKPYDANSLRKVAGDIAPSN